MCGIALAKNRGMSEHNPTPQQTENQISILADEFIAALHELENGDNTEDAAATLAALFSVEATLANAAQELNGKKVEGRDAIHRFWVNYKNELGAARSKFHHITTSEKAAGLFWTTQSQNAHDYHGATLLEFGEDGLILYFRGYYDTREL